jgi:hypothetical protein
MIISYCLPRFDISLTRLRAQIRNGTGKYRWSFGLGRRADGMGTGIIPDVLRIEVYVILGKHRGARWRRFGICKFTDRVP